MSQRLNERIFEAQSSAEDSSAVKLAFAGRRLRPLATVLLIVGLVACAQFWVPDEPERYQRTAAVVGAETRLGEAECQTCHGHQFTPRHHADCESCHGPGDIHVQRVMLDEGIRFPSSRDCLDCHAEGEAAHVDWAGSDHESAGLLCSSCHDPHNKEPRHLRVASRGPTSVLSHATPSSRLCLDCHSNVGARLNLPSHHPIREGMLDCVDCHSPHGSDERDLGTPNERCESCHQTQSGPWVYEHLPVVEDCGLCHEAHGASAQNLLQTTQPGVCATCHTIAEMAATHDPQAYVSQCTDCHGAVHGSFADPHLRR
jgi:DmsE family decaheme c-type cytochrome